LRWIAQDEETCLLEEKCQHCGYKIQSPECHNWSEIAIADEKCQTERKCLKCGETKFVALIDHTWMKEPGKTPCGMIRRCTRCQAEVEFFEHEINTWQEAPDQCLKSGNCIRCDKKVEEVAHQKVRFCRIDSERHHKVCSTCGKEADAPLFHRWGEKIESVGFERSSVYQRCLDCNEIKTIEEHTWVDH
jgi:DNA-directed RNA polymerase subunit RPC12/RpoP